MIKSYGRVKECNYKMFVRRGLYEGMNVLTVFFGVETWRVTGVLKFCTIEILLSFCNCRIGFT